MARTGQTLENVASGERITFRRTAAETNGELVAVDLALPAGARVAGWRHFHPEQQERFEVVEGWMSFRLGRKRILAAAGHGRRRAARHAARLRERGHGRRAGARRDPPRARHGGAVRDAVGLAADGRMMLGGIPRPLDLPLFLDRFEREVQAAFPPRWLQRIALAPLAWLARRLGYGARYALAPAAAVEFVPPAA